MSAPRQGRGFFLCAGCGAEKPMEEAYRDIHTWPRKKLFPVLLGDRKVLMMKCRRCVTPDGC